MRPFLACALLAALAVGACGGGGTTAPATQAGAPRTATTPTPPRPGPAPPTDTRVIRRWVDTLRHGDIAGAARWFALPAIVQYSAGGQAMRLTLRSEARRFNRLLPCGAELLRTERRGRYTVGVFRLTERPGARCDGPGAVVETGFVIRGARIAEWRRLPDPDPSGSAGLV